MEKGTERLCQATTMKPIRPLVVETLDALKDTGQYEKMMGILATLAPSLRKTGRIKTFEVAALMGLKRFEEALALLESKIVLADVREGDVLLTDLWFELMARRQKGSNDEKALAWARENMWPPKHLDFRMN